MISGFADRPSEVVREFMSDFESFGEGRTPFPLRFMTLDIFNMISRQEMDRDSPPRSMSIYSLD
eukprot:933016-Karenia_brevis.AAC.1